MYEVLIDADTNEQKKVIAIVEDQKLVEKYEETKTYKRLEGNIYVGKASSILTGMQSAFIDIGEEKNAYIHLKDLIPKRSEITGNKNEDMNGYDIKKFMKQNEMIMIQIKKDSTDKKGARISTDIHIPGRFIILLPNSNFVTVSQKIEDGKEKERLKQIVKEKLPEKYGAIIRTSCENEKEETIAKDIDFLLERYKIIEEKYNRQKKADKPSMIYDNEGIIGKVLTDLMDKSIKEITVNNKQVYKYIQEMLHHSQNDSKINLELKEKQDIFDKYDLKKQIEKAHNRKIWLKCGGFITIDQTEALTAIDINSGKYTGKDNLEKTVMKVNKEAAIEIAKQLRLKDIGGIIIIDFIDMQIEEDRQEILKMMKEVLKEDRSKTQIMGFTRLGLLEVTRKQICGK